VIEQHFIDDAVLQLRKLKELADRALQQIQEDHLFAVLDPEANSIAVIMKHMAGNMRSRWTDFLTADGEKPDQHPRAAARNVGGRLESRLRYDLGADTRRSRQDGSDSRPGAHGGRGDQPAADPLCRTRRPDRPACETLRRPQLALVEHSEGQITGVLGRRYFFAADGQLSTIVIGVDTCR
jgi:hypothetical protein